MQCPSLPLIIIFLFKVICLILVWPANPLLVTYEQKISLLIFNFNLLVYLDFMCIFWRQHIVGSFFKKILLYLTLNPLTDEFNSIIFIVINDKRRLTFAICFYVLLLFPLCLISIFVHQFSHSCLFVYWTDIL